MVARLVSFFVAWIAQARNGRTQGQALHGWREPPWQQADYPPRNVGCRSVDSAAPEPLPGSARPAAEGMNSSYISS